MSKFAYNVSGLCDGGAIPACRQAGKHKCSSLHKSSIEELPVNFAVSPHYCKALVELNLR